MICIDGCTALATIQFKEPKKKQKKKQHTQRKKKTEQPRCGAEEDGIVPKLLTVLTEDLDTQKRKVLTRYLFDHSYYLKD